MRSMFYECFKLSFLDLSGFEVSSGYASEMFFGCNRLTKITLGERIGNIEAAYNLPNKAN